jgi:hypothetical protein
MTPYPWGEKDSAGRTRSLGRTKNAAQEIAVTDRPQHYLNKLRDKYGHPHSKSIFRNWSPAAIRVLGIHRIIERSGGWC